MRNCNQSVMLAPIDFLRILVLMAKFRLVWFVLLGRSQIQLPSMGFSNAGGES